MAVTLSQNLKQRLFGAVLLLPPVLGVIYLGGLWFTGLLILGGAFMVFEWHRMTRVQPKLIQFSSALFVTVACLFGYVITPVTPIAMILLAMALPLVLVLTSLSELNEKESPILHIMRWSGNGTLYVALPMLSLAWIRGLEDGMTYVLWTFFLVWAADVGGYFFGKAIGGPKLAPKISPKKTWAGFFGGIILALVVTAVFIAVTGEVHIVRALLVAAMIATVSQMGDLFESAIKRAFDVKDSGSLIPGHGGILDRVDGLVFAAPVMAALLDIYVAN